MLARARAISRVAAGDDPALAVHRRQLDEIGELQARGALADTEADRARAEAARRLLTAAGRRSEAPKPDGAIGRAAVLAGVAAVPLLALGLYAAIGSPEARDRPFSARVREWRAADPATLGPAEIAAVLDGAVRERPADWRGFTYLGQARLASGDAYGALRAFQRAAELAPGQAQPWEGLGESFVAISGGTVDDDALRAFEQALQRDPRSVNARFQLGRARAAAGDQAGAAEFWRAAAADLPQADPRRPAILAELQRLTGGAVAPVAGADPAIRAMVDRLATRLERQPDDPAGWARLVRSYGVLGDRTAQAAALERARRQFAGRPDALALVEREAAQR